MILDVNSFLNEYMEESLENIDKISDCLFALSKKQDDKETLEVLLRLLHTIKGTSRMMCFNQVEEVVHKLEDVYKLIQNGNLVMTKRIAQLSFSVVKILRDFIPKLSAEETPEIEHFSEIIENITFATNGEEFITDFSTKIKNEVEETEESSNFSEVQSIRVNLSSINEIIRSYDKLITSEFRLKNSFSVLEDLIAKGENVGQQLRLIHEDITMLEQQAFSVQEKVISLRMLPLSMILRPLKHSVEEDALNLGKQIDFDIPLSDISLDKVILESLPGILIHLVRNSIDHGIESPEVRLANGKPEIGKISINAKQASNRIVITVSDDGAGIDFEKIRKKAMDIYPERADEIAEMNEKYLQQFLFVSGFSTASKQSMISGRGVGLDSVRTSMDKLKGRIRVRSTKNQGSAFELSLPLSLATQEGLFLQSGGTKFLVLSHYVTEIITEADSELIQLQHGTFLPLRNDLLPVYDASLVLGKKGAKTKNKAKNSIVVVEYLEKRIGIMVDNIVNYMTVVVKPLPNVLEKFSAVQGVVFDENYNIIPLIHVPDLMHRMNALKEYEVKSFEVDHSKPEYFVLVADDSHTTRQIEKIILEAEGYNVTIACDGIDALEKLKNQRFDILITDIKMPRMDGIVLIENIRRMELTKNLPVIVISSVFEEETLAKVKEAGAQGYIVKSDFERGNLVAKVKELLDESK